MNELTKTFAFVAVGVVLAGTAVVAHFRSQPGNIKEFERVGTEFYENFDEPEQAKFLEVAAYDENANKVRTFRVEQKDGLWRIPTHHDYPAEAKERLAATAASLIGIERRALAGRRESDHEKFGVIDPLSDEFDDAEAVGKRVTIGMSDEEVLADFIIGFEVKVDAIEENPQLREIRGDEEKKPLYYVRRTDEKETFISDLNIDISTKFSDWIEPDLMQLSEEDMRELVIEKYSVTYEDLRRGPVVFPEMRPVKGETETQHLTRLGGYGPWSLEGVNEETEEINSAVVSKLTDGIADLEIIGVRPRYKYNGKPLLGPNLAVTEMPEELLEKGREAIFEEMDSLQSDLRNYGFAIEGDEVDGQPVFKLLSDKGELSVGTADGLIYLLHFGSVFIGSDSEIEFGGKKKPADGDETEEKNSTDEKAEKESGENSSESEDEDSASPESEKQTKGRYLLLRVKHDSERVEGKPVAPTPPVEPVKPSSEPKKEPVKPPVKNPDAEPADDGKTDPDEVGKDSIDESDVPEEESGKAKDTESGCDFNIQSESGAEEQEPADEEASKDSTEQKEDPKTDTSKPPANGEKEAGDSKEKDPAPNQSKSPDPKSESEEGDSEGPASSSDDPTKDGSSSEPKETKPDPAALYQAAMAKYLADRQQYTIDLEQHKKALKEFEKRVAASKKKADELNARFADWYYVISADDLENLRLSKSDLVNAKEKPAEEPTGPKTDGSGTEIFDPNKIFPNIPGSEKTE